MSLGKRQQPLKKEQGITQYIQLSHLISPTIFETQAGHIGSTLRLKGVDIKTSVDEVINDYKRTLHQAIMRLGEEFFVLVTVHRHQQTLSLPNQSNHFLLKKISDRYHEQFKEKKFYRNDIYFTVIYKGITAGKTGKGLKVIDFFVQKNIKQARELFRQSQIKKLTQAIKELQSLLNVFQPQLLGDDKENNHSELLSFLSLFFNAGKTLRLHFSPNYPIFSKSKQKDEFSEALKAYQQYPMGRLSQYLIQKQIFFGEHIQFQGSSDHDTTFADILSIKTYGDQSASIMLDTLLQLDCECIITNSFAIEPKAEVLKRVDRHRHKMVATNDAAHSQMDELDTLKDNLASERVCMGYHHHTILLLANSLSHLEKNITQALKYFADAGMVAVRETMGKKSAFFAQVPGNQKYIPRVALITSENFVDFAPLHNDENGFYDRNHLGNALTLAETPSKASMYVNLHSKGPKNDPAKGHSSWIGGNGSGKTTALMLCATELVCRYNARLYSFDRNRGQDNFFRSIGTYFVLSPDYSDPVKLNPFQLEDNLANRAFCYQWLNQLALDEGDTSLSSDLSEHLKNCVDYAFDDLAKEHRKLSHALKILPKDFPRLAQLRRWIQDGEYGYLFDNDTDDLSISNYMGFDMTHFLDKEPSHVLTALFMYLFHRIEQTLDGSLVSILLDEGWQYLKNPYWANKLEKWLPTLRKANCQIHLATQSASTILNHPLRDIIQNNLASQFIFANPMAKRKEYIEGLELTEAEYETVRELNPQQRYFLYKQENTSTLCRFNMSHMTNELVLLSSNFKNVSLAEKIRKEVGSDPTIWVPALIQRSIQE